MIYMPPREPVWEEAWRVTLALIAAVVIAAVIIIVAVLLVRRSGKGEEAVSAAVGMIRCPSCSEKFEPDQSMLPRVTCPNCGTSGSLE